MKRRVLLATLLLAASARAGAPPCPFAAGARPADTLPAGAPHGSQIPLDAIVVLMQENRSFDHYFGQRVNDTNPNPLDPAAPPIHAYHETRYCEPADLDHSWNGSHTEFDNGKMDGFTKANVDPSDPTGSRTMGYYDRRDLPFYYALYRKFATGDRFFCSLLSQTFPNRFYLLAGTSFGHIRNDFFVATTEFAQPTIFNRLDDAGIAWKVYSSQLPFANLFAYVRNTRQANVVPIAQYFADAVNGTLPQVAFVDPIFADRPTRENDEHPPANVQVGQEFVSRVVKALFTSPQWRRAALFLTYDEHGGFFDHVPPPSACVPDAIPPMLQPGDEPGAFDRYGIRVPVVVVSPYARRRFVSHEAHDHTSILRFIATRFDLPALTARDANADPMLEFFDFGHPRFRKPPRLPKARINPKRLAQCGTP